jgi:hypothetical protein
MESLRQQSYGVVLLFCARRDKRGGEKKHRSNANICGNNRHVCP